MGDKTKIEWTDATWNPIRGCSRVSEGCRNCYAERQAARQIGNAYEGLVQIKIHDRGMPCERHEPLWTGEVHFIKERIIDPLRWRKPRRIFVNSMSDLFHEKVHISWISEIYTVMAECPRHIFQILTKRPERMRALGGTDLPNVWLGVSVEDQKTADERIPLLLQTPAAIRWVSYEPALGPVNFHSYFYQRRIDPQRTGTQDRMLGRIPFLDWLVAGGESGPGARPTHPDWFRSVRDQCIAAGVPFFFKQWGEWGPIPSQRFKARHYRWVRKDGEPLTDTQGYAAQSITEKPAIECMASLHKKAAGRLLDGREWNDEPHA